MSDTFGTILILAVVALIEGVRRLTPDAFVLRRILFGGWSAASPLELGRQWYLVAWPIPIVLPLVLGDDQRDGGLGIARHRARLRARARRTRFTTEVLRALGALILVAFIVGVPVATLRWDVFGLVVAVAIVLVACAAQALVTHIALRRTGASSRFALYTSLRMLWPFTAPLAAEVVQKQVVRGAPTVLVLVELLGRERFSRQMRGRLYDELHGGDVNGVLGALYDREALATFLRQPPDGAGFPFCPRCGSAYRAETTECIDCEGVSLVLASTN